jgi:hypothetical protein
MKSKNGPKIIIRPVEPRKKPSVVTKAKIKSFLEENISNFSDVVYMGWVRREYELKDGTPKRGMRFIAATAEKRLEARKIMKKSDNWGVDVWDLT